VIALLLAAATLALPPGYVNDAECSSCHQNVVRTYHDVGMSKSFYRPRADDVIEDFSNLPFRHAKSGEVMELRWREGRLVFRRWTGNGSNLFEVAVDWILGSGHHSRTYLYQTPNGELYQLPLAWYSQTKDWAMAPGYDRPDHEGVLRRARLECLFCHNAYPALAANARDGYWRNQGEPAALPEGIGCQRCHGPGGEHVRRAMNDDRDVKSSIVNPAKLAPQLRNDVCYECNMQPSVTVPGIRRFGRDINSFRPGQSLSDYLLRLDIVDGGMPRAERFEINHHPYRLEQSRCFRESGGKLSCLTCHDPHRKVPEAQRAAHYRAVCLQCHVTAHRASEDCTSCHMPRRRTQDVVHVVMTDHRIAITPPGANLLAPRDEREPVVEQIELIDPRPPSDGELYRVVAAARTGSRPAGRKLEQLLDATPRSDIEPYLDLAAALLRERRYADLEKTAKRILTLAPDHPLATEWLGLARADQGFRDEGIALLRKAAALDRSRVETQFNLGLQLQANGDREEAIAAFERALAGRPNFVMAWIHIAELRISRDAAADAYRHALAIDPRSKRAAEGLRRVVSR